MRWFAVASLIRDDPKFVQIAEAHGTAAFSVGLALFAEAAIQEKAGRAEITFRNFAHSIFLDTDTVRAIVATAATVGLIALEEEDDHSAVVRLLAWQRHQANYRKAKSRAQPSPDTPPAVTDSHGKSRDVTNKTRQEKTREDRNNVVGKPADAPLSHLLADLVEQNTGRKPRIGKKWLDAERLLIDRDGRDPDEAERLLRWCQADEFWRANILSLPKFREKYDRLLLNAKRKGGGRQAAASTAERRGGRDQYEQDLAWAKQHLPDVPAERAAAAIGTLRLGKVEITADNVRGRLAASGWTGGNTTKEAT